MKKFLTLLAIISLLGMTKASACTNFLVTKGASVDGSTMISYAADSHVLYGELYHYPAADYPEGAMRDLYDWDSGRYLGQIPEVSGMGCHVIQGYYYARPMPQEDFIKLL